MNPNMRAVMVQWPIAMGAVAVRLPQLRQASAVMLTG